VIGLGSRGDDGGPEAGYLSPFLGDVVGSDVVDLEAIRDGVGEKVETARDYGGRETHPAEGTNSLIRSPGEGDGFRHGSDAAHGDAADQLSSPRERFLEWEIAVHRVPRDGASSPPRPRRSPTSGKNSPSNKVPSQSNARSNRITEPSLVLQVTLLTIGLGRTRRTTRE